MAQPTATVTFLDHSGETSTVTIPLPAVTGANFATVEAAVDVIAADTLAFTIKALSLCNAIKSQVHLEPNLYAYTIPASANAQREDALLVVYQDQVNMKKFTISIPGPDRVALANASSDYVNTAALTWIAFVTAFELAARSPDGNAVKVLSGKLVGRNK